MTKTLLLYLLFTTIASTGIAQARAIDSLEKIISTLNADTVKVNKLNNLVEKLQYADAGKAAAAVAQSMQLAEKLKYNYGQAIALRLRGVLYADQTKLDSAKIFYDKALKLVEGKKDKPSLKQFGLLKHNFGVLYHQRQELDSAALFYFEAARIYKEIGEEGLLFFPYNNLVSVYSMLKDKDKALEYGIASRKAAMILNDPSKIAMAVNNEMAARLDMKQYEGVAEPLRENIVRATSISNKYAIAKAYHLLGQYFAEGKKQYDSSIVYFNRAVEIHKTTNNQYEMAVLLHLLGFAHKGTKDFTKAKDYLRQSNELAKSLELDQIVYYNLENLVEIEDTLGNINAAYAYLTEYVAVSDSLRVRNNRSEVNDLEKKYETEKKDAQIKLQEASLRQKNTLNYILIGGAAALLIISLLGYRNYRQKQNIQQQRISELEKEKQLTATEAVMKGEEQERSRLAKDLHDGLGGMLSGIKYSFNAMKGNLIMTPENAQAFERSMDMLDSSIKEMRRVAHNMMPEALVKFGLDAALKDFCNDINQSGALKVSYQSIGMEKAELDQTAAISVYRIIQELINNSIKHAAATSILVQLSRENDHLNITVEDDGKGFNKDLLNHAKGIGWSNIQNRIELLKGKLDVQSQPGSGTSVYIEIQA
ncbi:MAG: sensor histidine kinase [Sphingobacteriales bacterium]|nr:MAG: sensor histidine kinase [Sphingobacteriales bacterium]